MPAEPPPSNLAGFPARHLGTGTELFRLFVARDPVTGEPRHPWWFATAAPDGRGRFDLPAPGGACYLSDARSGVWLETFRTTAVVDRRDVDRRRLLIATRTGASLPIANLDAAPARRFGITVEIGAGTDHTLARAWAAALRAKGWAGVSAACRHDPSHVARTVALFGRAGPKARLAGWGSRKLRVSDDPRIWREIARFGVEVAAVPHDVPITAPPQRASSRQ